MKNKLVYGSIFFGALSMGAVGEIFFPGHSQDVAYCFSSYSGVQFCNQEMSPFQSAFFAFSAQALGEVCQKYGLFPGTFDWKDFISYGVGAGLVFGTEKMIRYFEKRKNPEIKKISLFEKLIERGRK